MVQARHALRKTQTRRLITLRNSTIDGYGCVPYQKSWSDLQLSKAYIDRGFPDTLAGNAYTLQYLKVPLPWGNDETVHRVRARIEPGDRIWWRETHKLMATDSTRYYPQLIDGRPIEENDPGVEEFHIWIPLYRATDEDIDLVYMDGDDDEKRVPWTPGIHMKRKWARFIDPVRRVWPERIQTISESDAIAEGVRWNMFYGFWDVPGTEHHSYASAADCYRILFNAINGPEAWERNDWVWVYEFGNDTQRP